MLAIHTQLERDCHVCLEPSFTNHISYAALIQKIDISDRRLVAQYAECSYMPCRFGVMHVSMHKTAYQKDTAMDVSSHNLLILACM